MSCYPKWNAANAERRDILRAICQATTSGATTATSTVSFADNTPAVSERKIASAHSCLKRSITTAIWSADSVTHIANGWKFDLKFILPHGQTFTLPTKLDTGAKATLVTSASLRQQSDKISFVHSTNNASQFRRLAYPRCAWRFSELLWPTMDVLLNWLYTSFRTTWNPLQATMPFTSCTWC